MRGVFLGQLRAGSVALTQKHSTGVENGRLSTAAEAAGMTVTRKIHSQPAKTRTQAQTGEPLLIAA